MDTYNVMLDSVVRVATGEEPMVNEIELLVVNVRPTADAYEEEHYFVIFHM